MSRCLESSVQEKKDRERFIGGFMALLERVSTLIRANLNDLIDKAEHPEKMIKEVSLGMDNPLLHVQTHDAIAIPDEHLLHKKQKENQDKAVTSTREAYLAVG